MLKILFHIWLVFSGLVIPGACALLLRIDAIKTFKFLLVMIEGDPSPDRLPPILDVFRCCCPVSGVPDPGLGKMSLTATTPSVNAVSTVLSSGRDSGDPCANPGIFCFPSWFCFLPSHVFSAVFGGVIVKRYRIRAGMEAFDTLSKCHVTNLAGALAITDSRTKPCCLQVIVQI